MSFLPKNILTAAAGIALAVGISNSAFAAQQLTWDPQGAGITSASEPVTFNNINIADYATIDVNNSTGVATETAYLDVGSLDLGNSLSFPSSLNTAAGFGMYFKVTSTAQLSPSGSNFFGKFTSLSFTLYGYNYGAGPVHYNFASNTADPTVTTPTTTLAGNPSAHTVVLATGSLLNDQNNMANIVGGIPNATADVTLNANPAVSGFFVSPSSTVVIDLNAQFSNDQQVITNSSSGNMTYFQIGNTQYGGGSGHATPTFTTTVPEPASLAILGMGLVGFGMFRRNRKQR